MTTDAAPPGRWAFLYPWCQALRGKLHLEGRMAEHSARWEYHCVAVRLPNTLHEADIESLCRIHEALDLLARVALVDNAVYRVLLVQQCRVPMHEDDQPLDSAFPPRFRFVFNEKYLEEGALSPAPLCRRYFINASSQRESEAYLEARSVLQHLESSLCRGEAGSGDRILFGLQFELVALPNDVLETHLRDLSTMLDAVQASQARALATPGAFLPLEMDAIRLDVGNLSASRSLTRRLTNMLNPRLPFSLFAFSLKQTAAEKRVDMRDSVGRFLRTVLCREETDLTPAAQSGIETLSVGCLGCDKWRFAALCSAISAASVSKNLRFYGVFLSSDTPELRAWKWQWLAYALFSKASLSSIASVFISAAPLTARDVAAIATVLATNSPPLMVFEGSTSDPVLRRDTYGYFPEGTRLNLLDEVEDLDTGEHTPSTVLLDRDSWLQIVSDSDVSSPFLDVVLPGYGVCRVDQSCASRIERRAVSPPRNSSDDRRFLGLEAFVIALKLHDGMHGGAVLADFLELIGAPLRFLNILAAGFYSISLSAIIQRCPNLTELFLNGIVLIDADNFAQDLERAHSKIVRLGLVNAFSSSHHATQLAEVIGDPTSRLATQMAELCLTGSGISWPIDETNVLAMLAMLETNRTLTYVNFTVERDLHAQYLEAFQRHDGEAVAVVKAKLAMECKVAFLSVVRGHGVTSTWNALDDRVLTCIFSFAATCATRTIRFLAEE
ncbi:hypothetical protein BBJ28_00000416 [Nothophytophthora sp. Chile5]|nr:hypothetical protein BBJ28_00000416 [Nothophytophthora sp. Chile5]